MLMDDPISALDANVKKKIFKQVFMRKFAGKTRVLVTHAVDFLHLVDTIILLKKGRVVMKGNYQDLKDSEYLKEVIGIHQSNQSTRVKKYGDGDSGSSPIDELIESIDDVESQSDSSSLGSHSEDEKDEDEPTAINNESVKLFRKNKRNDKLMRSFSVSSMSNQSSLQQTGKIMTNENEEDNKVGIEAYKKYLRYLGGWKFVVLS